MKTLNFTVNKRGIADAVVEQQLIDYCIDRGLTLFSQQEIDGRWKYTLEAEDDNSAFPVLESYLLLMRELL